MTRAARRKSPIRDGAVGAGNEATPRAPNEVLAVCRRVSGGRMSFLLYLVGSVVFIAGLAWLATMAGLSQAYILAGAAILLAVGIVTAISRTRVTDPA